MFTQIQTKATMSWSTTSTTTYETGLVLASCAQIVERQGKKERRGKEEKRKQTGRNETASHQLVFNISCYLFFCSKTIVWLVFFLKQFSAMKYVNSVHWDICIYPMYFCQYGCCFSCFQINLTLHCFRFVMTLKAVPVLRKGKSKGEENC